MISMFYVIAVACEPGFLCEAYRFNGMPEFATFEQCQVFRDEAASQYEVKNGLWVCVTDPVEKAVGGASEEEELVAGI